MANVPQLGTYVSEDNNFVIQIISANASNGVINAQYKASYSPQGPISVSGDIGSYAWVTNSQGQTGVAPFHIAFSASVRPEKWPYCTCDMWNGAYQVDNTLLMDGTRSYVDNKGVIKVQTLGTLKFSQQ